MLALALMAACTALAANDLTGEFRSEGDIRRQLRASPTAQLLDSESVISPVADLCYRVTTYAGQNVAFPVAAYARSNPIAMASFDFDGDGQLDWVSNEMPLHVVHQYAVPGKYLARFTVYDVYGFTSSSLISVEVLAGKGVNDIESTILTTPSFDGLRERRLRGPSANKSDTSETYFLLVADDDPGREDFWWRVCEEYTSICDTFGYDADHMVVVAGDADLPFDEFFTARLEDTVIIDHRFGGPGLDSAFNYLLLNMDSTDILHVIFEGHGVGYWDSSCVVHQCCGNGLPYESGGGRIFSDEVDPDRFQLESEFKLVKIRDYAPIFQSHGLYDTVISWQNGTLFRGLWVATFDSMAFYNSEKVSDTDIYAEFIAQGLRGDTDGDLWLDEGENWDWDDDGNWPIDTLNNKYVFDEDDWDTLWSLRGDRNHGDSNYGFTIWFDSGFDSTLDVCIQCDDVESPAVHGTDFDRDGILDRYDANKDGDYLDSIGVDEKTRACTDDAIADFLDSLSYRRATFVMRPCFGGGFINDLSRENVVIATHTIEGGLGYNNLGNFDEKMTGCWDMDSVIDSSGSRVVAFADAFNATPGSYSRTRLDDNGDGVGHPPNLPSGGDGYLADSIWWGILPPSPPMPILAYPLSSDTLYSPFVTFVWQDTGDADSFNITWAQFLDTTDSYPMASAITDTTYTTPNGSPLSSYPWPQYYWRLCAYKGLARTPWTESAVFVVETDDTCCAGVRGNVNGDANEQVDLSDLLLLIDFVMGSGAPLPCYTEANVNGSVFQVLPDLSDLTYLSNYLFSGGPPPPSCPSKKLSTKDSQSESISAVDTDSP
jgi:hypothetical protein